MIKKLLLIFILLICIAFQASAWNPMIITGNISASVSSGAIGDSGEGSQNAGITTFYYWSDYVTITAGQINRLGLRARSAPGDGVVCLHIWDDDNGTNPGTELGRCTVNITSGTGQMWYCNITPITITASSTYFLGFLHMSGTLSSYYDTNNDGGTDKIDYENTDDTTCIDASTRTDGGDIASDRLSITGDNNG